MRSAQRYPLSYPRRYVDTALPAKDEAGPAAGTSIGRQGQQQQQQEQEEESGGGGGTRWRRICEFHNFDPAGCRKGADGRCELDHTSCHFCGVVGHRALECAEQLAADVAVLEAMNIDIDIHAENKVLQCT